MVEPDLSVPAKPCDDREPDHGVLQHVRHVSGLSSN